MNSLVGYGSSSSSSEDENERDNDADTTKNEKVENASGVNLLTGDAGSDDNEEEGVDSESYKKACAYLQNRSASGESSKLPNPLAMEKLPTPNLDDKVKSTLNMQNKEDSVFVTSYQKNEEAKISVLEKHVKVTTIPSGNQINGKKVCWLYRKGQCRKGHRCQFAHDNDLVSNQSKRSTDNDQEPSPSHTKASHPHQSKSTKSFQFGAGYFQSQHASSEPVDEDSYMGGMKRKCRPGINDHLQPSKKSMSMLNKQREQERPWTVSKHS